MDDKRVCSTEIALVASNDVSQDSESRDCKIHKCHSEKRDDTRNDRSPQDDLESVPAIYIETSDEDDASEELLGDVERTETQLPLATDLGSSINYGNEFTYCISATNYNL